MDDEATWSQSQLAAVREVAPPPDVEAAWDGLSTRLRKARRRRFVGRGVVATVIVGLAAAMTVAGVSRRSPTEQQIDSIGPASSPASAPVSPPMPHMPAPYDPASGLTFEEWMRQPVPPDLSSGDLLVATCADGVGSIDHTVAAVGPRGLAVELRGGSHVKIVSPDRQTTYQLTLAGEPVADPRLQNVEIVPGTYEVLCGSPENVWDTDAVAGTVEVVDPDGWYTPGDVPLAICPGARAEAYDLGSMSFEELMAWRFGTEDVVRFGFEASSTRTFEVPGATGTFSQRPDGGKVDLMVCEGAAPLPVGDGLSPASTIRTDAEAAAWLGERVATTGMFALPGGAVIEGTDARLVRFDDVPGSSGANAPAPGFSVWVVQATYRTPDGGTGTAIYSFSTDPGPDERPWRVDQGGPENDPPSTDLMVSSWPPSIPDPQAWFDSLVDQAQ